MNERKNQAVIISLGRVFFFICLNLDLRLVCQSRQYNIQDASVSDSVSVKSLDRKMFAGNGCSREQKTRQPDKMVVYKPQKKIMKKRNKEYYAYPKISMGKGRASMMDQRTRILHLNFV